jgi:beta-glucosidase
MTERKDTMPGDVMTAAQPSEGGIGVLAYRDPSRPVEERVQDLLARMTVREKLAQLGAAWSYEVFDGQGLDLALARGRLADGIGQITRTAGATNLPAAEVAAFGDQIQRFLVEETRLGIPAIIHEESLHGVMARDATCFPQAIGQAATWDPELVEEGARLIARHLRAIGASQALAPVIDITRDPRWGRVEETYGEDPYLVASLGCAYVRGIQGGGADDRPIIATGKHMVGHGVPEGGLNIAPAHVGVRELHDAFLFPFEAAVRESGMGSIMHAYDELDGIPCVISRELLTDILRTRWGFDGLVVSDYLGLDHLLTLHELVADRSEAAVLALEAGLDMELPGTSVFGAPLEAALADGRLDARIVDQAVERVLRMKFRLGLFERWLATPGLTVGRTADELVVARALAERSIVLLQNDGILPLRPDLGSIAVIGPNADDARNLVGDYGHIVHIETLVDNRGREGVAGSTSPLSLQLTDELATWSTILDAIRAEVSPETTVRYARGCEVMGDDDSGFEAAVEAARGADVVILVLGDRSGLTAAASTGETRDRLELGLIGRQAELFAAVAGTGTPIVLVLVSGRPLAIPEEAARANAVLHAWVPGEAGPQAITRVLFGAVSPGGKLPISVPRHVGQVPVFYGHKPSGGRSHWFEDYVDGSRLPLWPFGFGLSYSRFELSELRLSGPAMPADGEIRVSVEVANVGDREADEVVQLYLRDLAASVTRPVKELRGFARVSVPPGERRLVTFTLAAEQLAFTGVDGRLIVEPGRHRIMLGTSSVDLPLSAEFEVVGEPRALEARSRFFSSVEVA